MTFSRAVWFVVVAMALAPAIGVAQSASRGGLILALPTSPRALALADIAASPSPDAWSLFTAPARLAAVRDAGVALASEAYLVSTRLSAGAVALPLASGTIALGATVLDYGTIQEIASSVPGGEGAETGRTYRAQDNAVVAGYARGIGRTPVLIGASLALVDTRVAELSGRGVAGSVGASWSSRAGWDIVGTVQHAGRAITLGATRGDLPTTVRLAAAAPPMRARGFTIRPLLEARAVRGGGQAFAGAADAEWQGSGGTGFALRAGYSLRAADDDRWPLSLGAGARLGRWAVDYAVTRFATLDVFTHRIGVRYTRRPAVAR